MGKRLTVYLDCDDTILSSSEAIINILNHKYHLNKNIQDLKDYGYKSIYPQITSDEVLIMYESEEFWNKVTIKEDFKKVYNDLKEDFNFVVVSCGTKKNLRLKEDFLKRYFKEIVFIGVEFKEEKSFCKAEVDMSDGIQIDDNRESVVNTNAACRILLENDRPKYWNKVVWHQDNLYIVKNWNDIKEMLLFWKEHPEFVKRCYE